MSMQVNDNPNEFGCESQNGRILQYLKDGETVTSLECLQVFGSIRAASRINDLRSNDNDIKDVWIEVESRDPFNGEKKTKRVKAYYIEEAFAKLHSVPVDENLPKIVERYATDKAKRQ